MPGNIDAMDELVAQNYIDHNPLPGWATDYVG